MNSSSKGAVSQETDGCIDVLLADDFPPVRDWLKTVLEAKGYRVVAEAANGQEAVCLALLLRPHLIVMDFEMPLMNGFEAARQILREFSEVPVLILTADADAGAVREGLDIGIRGFAAKTGRASDILHAIQEVLKGKTYLGPGFSLP